MAKDSENDMANSPGGGDIFDVRKIRRLIELMNDHDLNEIDLRDGDIRVRLRKRGEQVVAESRPYVQAAPAVPAAPATSAAAPAAPVADNYHVIKSPIVGTFYAARDPKDPPLVKVGDPVGNESVVCIIEAMKVFNEIAAEIKGKVVAVLVENGSPVEYNQPLFKIDTKG
jgi:acetyl-CoA carboxylase biotin carboxyl carrier protein